jgi:hypothetical protein
MSDRVPVLSIVVVVYAMPDQAKRTLYTLSPAYQRNVDAGDYEVVVVENESPRLLGAFEAERTGPNVRYFLCQQDSSTPVLATNFGVSKARGRLLGIMVDGARLLSPGVVELALMAHRAVPNALVSVPGYHLGTELQQRAVKSGYDESAERLLLSSIAWPEDGYRLFDVACFSGSCAAGFLLPYAESNCLCLTKDSFDRLKGLDERFVSRGGGYVNLDLYLRATELPDVTLFVTPGEGTFHQFHGGITTGGVGSEQRERLMIDIHDEYKAIRGHAFALPRREALLLGRVPPSARRFVEESVRNWGRRSAP